MVKCLLECLSLFRTTPTRLPQPSHFRLSNPEGLEATGLFGLLDDRAPNAISAGHSRMRGQS